MLLPLPPAGSKLQGLATGATGPKNWRQAGTPAGQPGGALLATAAVPSAATAARGSPRRMLLRSAMTRGLVLALVVITLLGLCDHSLAAFELPSFLFILADGASLYCAVRSCTRGTSVYMILRAPVHLTGVWTRHRLG